MLIFPALLALICFLLSMYLFMVEKKVKQNSTYKSFCDISDKISCTKVAKSSYSTFFLMPNSLWGMLFYTMLFFASISSSKLYIFALSIAGAIASIILAFILYGIIKTVCLVCTSTYIINILLVIYSYWYL